MRQFRKPTNAAFTAADELKDFAKELLGMNSQEKTYQTPFAFA